MLLLLLLLSCFSRVDSVRPHRRKPTRLPRPWDSPGKNTGVGCHVLLQCMKVKSKSEVTQSYPTLSDPWTAAYQAPLSMGFSRQKHWSGLPLPFLATYAQRQNCALNPFLPHLLDNHIPSVFLFPLSSIFPS